METFVELLMLKKEDHLYQSSLENVPNLFTIGLAGHFRELLSAY
jgi:hypothetical protein